MCSNKIICIRVIKLRVLLTLDSPWYEEMPVGKNTLSTMVEMCVEGGIAMKTNHSLRATGTSAMSQAISSAALYLAVALKPLQKYHLVLQVNFIPLANEHSQFPNHPTSNSQSGCLPADNGETTDVSPHSR